MRAGMPANPLELPALLLDRLYDAVEMLVHSRVHRLPIIDVATGEVLHIITHKRILKFLMIYVRVFQYFTRFCMSLLISVSVSAMVASARRPGNAFYHSRWRYGDRGSHARRFESNFGEHEGLYWDIYEHRHSTY